MLQATIANFAHAPKHLTNIRSQDDYDKAVAYAEALGVLRKEFRSKGFFFVSRMEQMGVYFKNQVAKRRALAEQQQAGPCH